jgi:hypothetical protein
MAACGVDGIGQVEARIDQRAIEIENQEVEH